MTRRRYRDAIAPTMFPFLAVLLCTMGSLVLILMLVVANAQASTQQVVAEQEDRKAEIEAALELQNYAFEKRLTSGQLDMEKRRLHLQHVEEHIQELLSELEDLKRTEQLLAEENAGELEQEQQVADKISELEKQLAEAAEELNESKFKPDGDKPIFAVIPYQGRNGTHRRPIYIECTSKGAIIQPEGVLLPMHDLAPPHGPGNPLDAALRTIRTEFKPANQALTSTAYPLLIVRPSGIRSYSLARQAMTGWDDQFGYELIEEELDLAFPQSTPGLQKKIESALVMARDRQRTLIAAMPGRYGGSSSMSGSGSYGGTSGAASYGDSQQGSNQFGSAQHGRSHDGDASYGNVQSNGSGGIGGSELFGRSSQQGTAGTGPAAAGNSVASSNSTPGYEGQPGFSGAQYETGHGSANANEGSYFASGQGSQLGEANPPGSVGGSPDGSSNGSNEHQGSPNHSDGNGSNGPSGSSSSSSGSPSMSSGTQIAIPGMNASSQLNSNGSSQTSQTASGATGSSRRTNGSTSSSQSPSGRSGHAQGQSSGTPVAAQKGRGWAFRGGKNIETPVVRRIRVTCGESSWIVEGTTPIVINMDGTPQQRAERLVKTVQARVKHWGVAIEGGYWQPVLSVSVVKGAEWRFNQLNGLLEGSGLHVERYR